MQNNEGLIAISQKDADEFGCVSCGYFSRFIPVTWCDGVSGVAKCASCDQLYVILAEGVEKLPSRANINHTALQEHPRQGIPANHKLKPWECLLV